MRVHFLPFLPWTLQLISEKFNYISTCRKNSELVSYLKQQWLKESRYLHIEVFMWWSTFSCTIDNKLYIDFLHWGDRDRQSFYQYLKSACKPPTNLERKSNLLATDSWPFINFCKSRSVFFKGEKKQIIGNVPRGCDLFWHSTFLGCLNSQ